VSDATAPQRQATEAAQQQARARRSYDRMSRVYGMLSDSSEKRFVKDAIEELLRPEEGEVVLEPGFGTGQALMALAVGVGESGRVAGIDISEGMLDHARRRLEHHGLAERVHLRLGSATELPYRDSTFDAVFMSFTLELFADDQIPTVLAECVRVLKPTGRLCVACMSDHGGSAAMEKLYEWSHEHFPSFVDCRPIDAAGALETAGYTVVTERPLTMWGLAVDLVLATPG
jgi:demethylmenaquinone methyltransferase/2-methoxy-6-polyprenyl-1,4-benzoquinol methylase